MNKTKFLNLKELVIVLLLACVRNSYRACNRYAVCCKFAACLFSRARPRRFN